MLVPLTLAIVLGLFASIAGAQAASHVAALFQLDEDTDRPSIPGGFGG